jgi:calpain-5
MKHFTTMAICEVLNTSLFSAGKTWVESSVDGSWSLPDRSGGCLNNKDTFLNNPQYRFDVTGRDGDVCLSLAQKTTRSSPDIKNITMGFTIMKVHYYVDVKFNLLSQLYAGFDRI